MSLKDKKLFLLDLDGTVYLEESLLPGAGEFLEYVKAHGMKYRFLTNNSSRGVSAGLEKMHRLGVAAEKEDFLTAVETTIHYLHQHRKPEDVYYIVGTDSFREQMEEAGFQVRHDATEDVTCLLVAYDTELNYEKVEKGCRVLFHGADFLATNPDLACPTLFGFVPDCGTICQLFVNACGKEPTYIGKPDPTMIELALSSTGCTREETLMIGDRLYTDIACGINAGVDTLLVLTGEATREDGEKSETPPTYTLEHLGELLEKIRE